MTVDTNTGVGQKSSEIQLYINSCTKIKKYAHLAIHIWDGRGVPEAGVRDVDGGPGPGSGGVEPRGGRGGRGGVIEEQGLVL